LRSFIWIAIALIAAMGLVATRLPAGIAPSEPPARQADRGGWNRIVVAADDRGHFLLTAEVNGTPVTFLVDSGASTVVLSPDDARRIGMPPERLRFTERFRTANGMVRAAPVELREIRIGQLAQRYVPASVNEAPLGVSLLGMTFLSRLESWSVEGGRLALYW
jgi:aspartyl protease family protein